RSFMTELEEELLRFPKSPHDDLCLAGDTKISTLLGDKKISEIGIGEFVLTRAGYKKVLASQRTGVTETNTYILDGKEITSTPRHKVIVGSEKIQIDH